MEKRKLTKADIDKVRHIEGFPIARDEDIIALSRPPYYTACPNPFIADFIAEHGTPYDETTDDYHREPFAADVSEGKNDPIYMAHSYHTKVPYKAIMRYILHYTKPGDIVLDGFCGTGMTGVAAQMCGAPDNETRYAIEHEHSQTEVVWGARNAIVGDLAPIASFLSDIYNHSCSAATFYDLAKRLIEECKVEFGWMFQTNHVDPQGKPVKDMTGNNAIGELNYVVWSDVFVCPTCSHDFVFYDVAVDSEQGKVLDKFYCPHCHAELSKRDCSRAIEVTFDTALQRTVQMSKQVPVLIAYFYSGKRYQKKPDQDDIRLLRKIEEFTIPYPCPTRLWPEGEKTKEPIARGIEYVHQMYSKRNLAVLSAYCAKAKGTPAMILMEYNGITTTLINGSMSLEERNASLQQFRMEKQMLISTDAGGEALNLQCAHIVINYDLPWNPMKIEQRIGRADRIGQTDDVQVYNFILKDTIENRVRNVLEMKLAVILQELGIDKLQDVLDEGTADMDFTKVYIDTIVSPKFQNLHISEVEKNARKQVDQFQHIQSVIHEDKTLVGDDDYARQQHSFHMLLKEMLYQYRSWKGYDPDWKLDWEISLSDKQVQDILARKQIWHQSQGMQTIHFQTLKTENGVFSLWELSLGPEAADKNIIPIFISDQGVYRPAASRLIWEELLKGECVLEAGDVVPVEPEFWSALEQRAQEVATDAFLQMRDAYYQRHEQQYRKQQRALTLRIEAAQRIGIENIRVSRIARLENALQEATAEYERHQEICPTFSSVVAFRTR